MSKLNCGNSKTRTLRCWRNAIELTWTDAESMTRREALTDGSLHENEALAAFLGAGFEDLAATHAPRRDHAIAVCVLSVLAEDAKMPKQISKKIQDILSGIHNAKASVKIGIDGGSEPDDVDSFLSDRESLALRYERRIGDRWMRGAIQVTLGSRHENLAIIGLLGASRYGHLAEVAFERRFTALDPLSIRCIASSDPDSMTRPHGKRAISAVAALHEACTSFMRDDYRNIEVGPFTDSMSA